jgi:dolichol-phosphate hexosyltransferase
MLHLVARLPREAAGASTQRPKMVSARTFSSNDQPPVILSIVMAAYNEERTVGQAVNAVLSTSFPCEIELIVVDDGSTDATPEILAARESHPRVRVLSHSCNRGKGAALMTAASAAAGTHIVPFDADLEYVPEDLVKLVTPVLEGRADVVYGIRLFGVNTVYQSYRSAIGNRALTLAANVLFDSYVSDIHTCLKLLPLELFTALDLCEHGFGLDTEITAKLLQLGLRPFEVPVSYHSRSYLDGKKITWRDGVECLGILVRVRLRRPRTGRLTGPLEEEIGLLASPRSSPALSSDPKVLRPSQAARPESKLIARV